MKLRLPTLATGLVLVLGCHHKPELTTIHLEWRADKVPYKDSILKTLSDKHLKLVFADTRAENAVYRSDK